jgi:hypothetical protein
MVNSAIKCNFGLFLTRRRRVQTLLDAWIPDIIQLLNLVCATYRERETFDLEDELVVTVTTDPTDERYPLGFKDQVGLPLNRGSLHLDPSHSYIFKLDELTGHFTIVPFDEFLSSLITEDNIDDVERGHGEIWVIDAELDELAARVAA